MSSRFGNIGVLMGGYSSEREISLRSGQAVFDALQQSGHQVVAIDITSQDKVKILEQLRLANIDVAFIALHGKLGEDGGIQGICEEMALPYTGCGVAASQKAFDKTVTQKMLKSKSIPVAEHVCITDARAIDFKAVFAALKKLPFVVKAACEGSSIGIYIVRHPSQWESMLKDALKYGPHVIIEKFIKGRELTVGIFDRQPLPIVEIQAKTSFFDFNAKYQKGATSYVVPAVLSDEITKLIQHTALNAYDALGCEGFGRVDIRLDEALQPYVLEVNTIPGFTETSLFPKAAAQAGYGFIDVCEKLLDLAYAKKIQR